VFSSLNLRVVGHVHFTSAVSIGWLFESGAIIAIRVQHVERRAAADQSRAGHDRAVVSAWPESVGSGVTGLCGDDVLCARRLQRRIEL